MHSDYLNKPRFKPNEEFYAKGRVVKVHYCTNLEEFKQITQQGRRWLITLESDANFPEKWAEVSEDYLWGLKNQPKKVTDHNWTNQHSVRF